MFDNHVKKMASEQLVTMNLVLKGFIVLQPLTSILDDYDLVIEVENGFKKIQVKSAAEKDGRMIVDLRRSSNSKTGRIYSDNAYDIVAIVNLDRMEVAYIPKNKMTAKNSINLWCCDESEIPTKGRTKEPLLFKDFTTCPTR